MENNKETKETVIEREEKSVNNSLNPEIMEDQNNIEKNSESNNTTTNNLNNNDMKTITLKDMIHLWKNLTNEGK